MNPRYALIAAAMMHVEGYYSTASIAYKNNNPGNLRHYGSSTGFVKFATKQDGFNALVSDIARNAGLRLDDFISRYAPPTENKTSVYVAIVSNLTGIAPDEVI